MRITNRGRFAVGTLVTIGIALTSVAMNHAEASKGDCTVAVAGTISDTNWNDLKADGWHGFPNDGMEALWSPECTTAQIVTILEKQSPTGWTCPAPYEFDKATFACIEP